MNRIISAIICFALTVSIASAQKRTDKPDMLFRIVKKHLFGYIDKSGRVVVEPQYEDARSKFSEGLVAVEVNKKWGYIDTSGKTVIQPQFNIAYEFVEGLAQVKVGTGCELCGKWGFIDTKGKIVIEPQFESVDEFSEGLARFQIGSKHGFIDRTGKIVIKPTFDYVSNFSGGMAEVQINCSAIPICDVGYIDKKGNYVWKPTQ